MKKNVLIYPCDTEIGLEIYRALCYTKFYNLYGDYKVNGHGNYIFSNFVFDLPFINDDSNEDSIKLFNKILNENKIDILYPAMDGVVSKFAEYRNLVDAIIVAPDFETAKISRSKKLTYEILRDSVRVPKIFDSSVSNFPVFVKPDMGQGSVGAMKISSAKELNSYFDKYGEQQTIICEYIDGDEYTVDCFTNFNNDLIYVSARQRNRMKNGISMNCTAYFDERIKEIAYIINSKIHNKGAWFFQIKLNSNDEYVLMEVASRIAGTSSFCRGKGVNLPLLTLFEYCGHGIDYIQQNEYNLSLDRALYNSFKLDIDYSTVYIDYDDTIIINNKINTQIIAFLFQCINKRKKIVLVSRHEGDLISELEKFRIKPLFDEIMVLEKKAEKYEYIKDMKSIFIDDSFGERIKIKQKFNIPVFDTSMVESLLDGSVI